MEENKELEKPHKRRVRYKGTHPGKFEENCSRKSIKIRLRK